MTSIIRRIAAFLFVLLISVVALADTYCVSPKGDDTNTGTELAPFHTLGKAATVAKSGDTVLVKAGEYSGGIALSVSGSPDKPIVFRSFGDGEVRIAGRIEQKTGFKLAEGRKLTYEVEESGDVAAVAVDLNTTKFVMEGLERVGSIAEVEAGGYRYCHDKPAGRLYVRLAADNPEKGHTIHVLRDTIGMNIGGANVVVDGFTFSGFASCGVVSDNSRNVTLQNCRVSLCGYPWGAGIGLYKTNSFKVKNCILYRLMNGIMLTETTNTEIDHTTLYRTRAHGIMLEGGSGNSVRNSILYAGGVSGSALYIGKSAAAGLKLDYNCYLDSGTSILITWAPIDGRYPTFWDYRAAIRSQDAHSLSDDPMFVSIAQGKEDFHLQPSSPCLTRAEDGRNLGAL